ncbi:MAG: toxin-antitoxin system YwqK family antitoxin [Flavobacteriales bacterium]|nr:toxin-antitoxin system YwqK family antitoxin [Flavobacteriales bacterium]MCB9448712.1 toxin-antitoxin system YwqK family antitoxin [Flavobacteriales bacterium]
MAVLFWSACKLHSPEPDLSWFRADTLQLQPSGGIFYFHGHPFTGRVFSCYKGANDTLEVQQYLHGKEHGAWKKFFPDNHLQEIRYFSHGKKEGMYETWWSNGQKRLSYQFENDEYEGACREWNERGLLIKDMHYEKGHEAGLQRVWYDNGKIKSNYQLINGRRYGLLGTKNCTNVGDSIQ